MVKKNLKKYWLIWLSLLVLLLRLPSLFEPFTYADEGIYLVLGQALRRGLVWYRDIHDNKPPMLYLIAALAGNLSTYRLILLFWSLTTIFVFYKLAQLLFSQNKSAIIASTTAFAILTSTHTFEGNIGNAENFMLLPTIVAFYLIFKRSFGAGMLFGLATLFKVPGGFDFLAALTIVFFLEKANLKSVIQSLISPQFWLMIFGFITPIALSLIYYHFQGALNQYFTAAFAQNIPYLSSWSPNRPQMVGLPLPLITRASLVLIVIILLFIFRKRVSRPFIVATIWFSFALFAALLSSRPYPHYLIQILPAFSLSFGLFFNQPKKYLKERLVPILLVAGLIITWIAFRFWYYANLPYLINFYQYALRIKNQQEYFSGFDPRAETIYKTAEYIRIRTLPDEKIFIWGTDPSIYVLSKRLPVGRYTVAYHIIDFDGFKETIRRLKIEPPRYIILMTSEKRPFPELNLLIEQKYTLENTIGDAKIYHRLF